VAEVEIGIGKAGRRSYGFGDISILPVRRTRDPEDVDISWEIDAYKFGIPVLAAPTDGVTSPATAIAMGRLGGAGVVNLEGLWTRHEDPDTLLDELAKLDDEAAASRLRELYAAPIRGELIIQRMQEVKRAGVVAAGALSPQRVNEFAKHIAQVELDLLVITGTVVSAEHVTRNGDPLNLKRFIREFEVPTLVGGCASYQAALHLMRTGAVGVLIGAGSGEISTTQSVLGIGAGRATAVADARGARMRHLDETGVYVHIIADGGIYNGGDLAKAFVCGADAVMLGRPLAAATEAPGRGFNWTNSIAHPTLPRGRRVAGATRGTLEEILVGPARSNDGELNLCGALRRSMAMCGYQTLKEFQKADVTVTGGTQ